MLANFVKKQHYSEERLTGEGKHYTIKIINIQSYHYDLNYFAAN